MSQIPFTPLSPEALARLTPAERISFLTAAGQAARDNNPPLSTTVELLLTIHRLLTSPDPEAMVEAVMDVLAPWAEGIPGVCERVRYPLIRFDHDGTAVMPSDGQVRMLAEQIVTRLRTATPA
jgi:hypothetical protein